MAIVTFSTIVQGMWSTVDIWIHLDETDLIVFRGDVTGDIFSVLDKKETAAKLTAVPGVAEAVGTLWHILPVEDQPFFVAEGLHLEDIQRRFDGLVEGRHPTTDNEVLLGSIAQRALKKNVGDPLRIQGKDFQVVGIFQTGVVFSDGAVILPLRCLQQLAAREGRVTAFQLRLEEGSGLDTVEAEMERCYPELVAISDVEEYNKVDQGLEILESMVWMITVAAVVIGSIIIANTMWMSVVNEPRVLLADEPTGAIDSQNSERLLDLLEELQREAETTVVVVTHNPQVAERAGRILHMLDGRMAAPGRA